MKMLGLGYLYAEIYRTVRWSRPPLHDREDNMEINPYNYRQLIANN